MNDRELTITLPRSVFRHAWLTRPDTKYDEDGLYTTKCVIGQGDFDKWASSKEGKLKVDGKDSGTMTFDEFMKLAQEDMVEDFKGLKPAARKKLGEPTWADPAEEDVDDDGEATGDVVIKTKSKASGIYKHGQNAGKTWTRKLRIFGPDNKPLNPDKLRIYGGTIGRLVVKARPYFIPKDGAAGITFYIEAVKVLQLAASGTSAEDLFDDDGEDDGYAPIEELDFDDAEDEEGEETETSEEVDEENVEF